MIKTTEETRENNKTQQLIEILNGTNVYDEFSQTIIDYAKSLNRFSYFKGTKELNVFVNIDGILSLNRIINRTIGVFKIRPSRMSSDVCEHIEKENIDYLSNYFKRSIKSKAVDVVSKHSRLVLEKSTSGFENIRLLRNEFILLSEITDSHANYEEKTYIVENLVMMEVSNGTLTDDSFTEEESKIVLDIIDRDLEFKFLSHYFKLYLYTKMKLNPENFNSFLLEEIKRVANYNHTKSTIENSYQLLEDIMRCLKIIKEFTENLSNIQLNFEELESAILSELRVIVKKVRDSTFKRLEGSEGDYFIRNDVDYFVDYINKINWFMNNELNMLSSYNKNIVNVKIDCISLFDIINIESEVADSNAKNYAFNINSDMEGWERILMYTDTFLLQTLRDEVNLDYAYDCKLLELKKNIKSQNIKIHKPIFDSLYSYINNKIDGYSFAGLEDNNKYSRYLKILNILEVDTMCISDTSITKHLFELKYRVNMTNVFDIERNKTTIYYKYNLRNLNSIVVPELYKIALI